MNKKQKEKNKTVRLLWLGCFVLTFCMMLNLSDAQAFQSYFLAPDIESSSIDLFPKWISVLNRTKVNAQKLQTLCQDEGPYTPCRLKEWKDFLLGIQKVSFEEQVSQVNAFINSSPYIEDIINWGAQDYWETPYEFQKSNGDCEDFAIAKFMSLRALGVDERLMRVTIVKDLNLGGIIHAVLLVKLDGDNYIMDNQIKQVVEAKKVYHYLPLYAINEAHWWQYLVTQ